MTYKKELTASRFGLYHGWWSDNLQNKDNTLLAGQAKSNIISVGKDELLTNSDWINANDLVNTNNSTIPKSRLKSLYVCLFNRHRVKYSSTQTKYSFLHNVYQNNVIPLFTEYTSSSKELIEHDCKEPYQYSPFNISEVDGNIVKTTTDRDWM